LICDGYYFKISLFHFVDLLVHTAPLFVNHFEREEKFRQFSVYLFSNSVFFVQVEFIAVVHAWVNFCLTINEGNSF